MPLLLLVFGPALAALLLIALPRNSLSRWVIAVPAAAFVYLIAQTGMTVPVSVSVPWVPSLGVSLSLRLDGLGLLFALVVTGVGTLVLLYASAYFAKIDEFVRFSIYTLLFMSAMLGVVLSSNLLLIFVFWEITSVTSYLLIGFKHEDDDAREGARRALLVTGGGGLALLAGILLVGSTTGSLEISEIIANRDALLTSPLYLPVVLLILAGAFTKSAQWPFQFWLPGAMAAPTPASTYLHSATMVKAGVFLIARMTPVLGHTGQWTALLAIFGLMTFLYGGVYALRQHDLKAILAYSTVSWLGALVAVQAPGSEYGSIALAVGVIAHALYKAALFLVAGIIDHETGTRDIRLLGSLSRVLPLTFVGALIAAISMAGLPPLLGFVAKETLKVTALYEGLPQWLGLLFPVAAVIGSALTVATALRVLWDSFLGPRGGELPHKPHEAPWPMWIGPLVLGAFAVVLPFVLTTALDPLVSLSTSAILGEETHVHLHLFEGVNTAFILSVIAIALGVGLFLLRRPVVGWLAAHAEPSLNAGYLWFVNTALPDTAARVTGRLQNGRLRYYMLIILGTLIIAILGSIWIADVDLLERDVLAGLDWHAAILCLLLMVGAVAATIVPTRLSAIVVMGLEGALLAILFALFGAPDLAFTQLMIEVVTLVLFVLAFHFLPDTFMFRRPRGRRAVDVIFAATIGIAVTVVTLAAISNRVAPSTSQWYIDNAEPLGHGHNVVNVILVDFRGLDTQGEITVLVIAAMGVVALLRLRPAGQPRGKMVESNPALVPEDPSDGHDERQSLASATPNKRELL
jgi:multicomponent Na+:H+ antiporter subunit A